jgi:hypothetical protein
LSLQPDPEGRGRACCGQTLHFLLALSDGEADAVLGSRRRRPCCRLSKVGGAPVGRALSHKRGEPRGMGARPQPWEASRTAGERRRCRPRPRYGASGNARVVGLPVPVQGEAELEVEVVSQCMVRPSPRWQGRAESSSGGAPSCVATLAWDKMYKERWPVGCGEAYEHRCAAEL